MKHLSLISLCAFILLNPIIANADPKSDIATYEAAIEKGNVEEALKSLNIALNNAKSLPADDPYLAAIAYDNAYFFSLFQDYKTAFDAIQIADKAYGLKPTLAKDLDKDEYKFLLSFLRFMNENNTSNFDNSANNLNNAVNIIKSKKHEDNLYYTANLALAKYYRSTEKWNSLAEVSQRQLDTIENGVSLNDDDKRIYTSLAYTNRAQAKFIASFGTNIKTPMTSVINKSKYRQWADSYGDIVMAFKTYGKPTTDLDKDFAEIDATNGMIFAYAKTINDTKSAFEINDTLKFNFKDYQIPMPKECANVYKNDFNINYQGLVSYDHPFAYAKIVFDINKEQRATNIRLIGYAPSIEIANNVIKAIENKKFDYITANTPEICLKDLPLKARFYTRYVR